MTTSMLKIVLDTNMVISASVFGGMVEKIIDLIVDNKLKLFISFGLTNEIFKKLNEFQASEEIRKKVIALLKKGVVTKPKIKITVCRDPADNFVLELAESAEADYLITRDKDLLDLADQKWKETQITKPEAFLPILRKMNYLAS